MPLTRIEVTLPSAGPTRSYPVFVDPDGGAESRLAAEVRARGGAVIGLLTDETVAALHLERVQSALEAAGMRVERAIVKDGERSKSLAQAEAVAERWAAAGLDRGSLVLALGGGVVGDLGGFIASIFLRGVACVQVPTTLLAQVDAAVGGKTAVNLLAGKNLVGTFHQPLMVYADVTALATLPPRELASGLAEVVKHGAIADPDLLALLESQAERARAGDPALLAALVARSCQIKAEVVMADERERAGGKRALLNFGHTIGHALEADSLTGAEPLRHGEAVALGMLAAARVGARLGVGDATLEARLQVVLSRLGLPTDLDRRLAPEVLARVGVDKKRAGGEIAFVIVERAGVARLERLSAARLGEILRTGARP